MSAAKKGEDLSSPHGLALRAGADRTISFQCQLARNSRYQQAKVPTARILVVGVCGIGA